MRGSHYTSLISVFFALLISVSAIAAQNPVECQSILQRENILILSLPADRSNWPADRSFLVSMTKHADQYLMFITVEDPADLLFVRQNYFDPPIARPLEWSFISSEQIENAVGTAGIDPVMIIVDRKSFEASLPGVRRLARDTEKMNQFYHRLVWVGVNSDHSVHTVPLAVLPKYLSFDDAHLWASQNLTSREGWLKLKERKLRPKFIPPSPPDFYRTRWTSWDMFLKTDSSKKTLMSFEDAMKWAKVAGITSEKEWFARRRPLSVPANPRVHYSRHWQGWDHFLGQDFLPFQSAREWAQSKNLKSPNDWKKISLPKSLPRSPRTVYSKQWKSWDDFLGLDRKD